MAVNNKTEQLYNVLYKSYEKLLFLPKYLTVLSPSHLKEALHWLLFGTPK